jgi:hypothetical protein
MAVEVNSGTVFQATIPKPLFGVLFDSGSDYFSIPTWDVTSDGRRFLISKPAGNNSVSAFTVVLHWTALLKK